MTLKIYKLTQNANSGYDTYDGCVVIAENEELARSMNPDPFESNRYSKFKTWCQPKDVDVEFLGYAKENENPRIVCSSFNAG